ncbi:MAG: permease prefix domain 1-containing protein, partial [Vicinamibacteria bacterium]
MSRRKRLGSLLFRMSVEEEVDRELSFHVEMRIRELISRGMSPEEARARALAGFGDLGEVRETCRRIAEGRDRDMRIREWWDELKQDLLFAARQIRTAPALTALVVMMLGVGIGAGSTVFSVVNAVLLRPLPVPEPDRLVRIFATSPHGIDRFSVSEIDFLDFRAQQRSFDDLAVCGFPNHQFSLAGDVAPVRFEAVACTGAMLPLLTMAPIRGRTFTEEEERMGGDSRVIVLGEALWKRLFASDPDIVGRT